MGELEGTSPTAFGPTLSLTDPAAIAALFPATRRAQQEAFSALIAVSDGGGGPEERAAALSNSVLASAYVATSSGHAASHGPTDEQSEVTDIWDKMERTRLRDESIERVRDVCASWDAPAVASLTGERKYAVAADGELKEVQQAVSRWLSAGEDREERAAQVTREPPSRT